MQDVALLQSLGVRVVLVLGSSEQVEELSQMRGVSSEVVDGYRVTCPEALEVAMVGAVQVCVWNYKDFMPIRYSMETERTLTMNPTSS